MSARRSEHHASTSGSNSSSNGRKEATEGAGEEEGSKLTAYLAPAALLLGMGLLVGGGYAFKSQLRTFIDYFVEVVDTWGPLRCWHPPNCCRCMCNLGTG